jgi:hypothetical protein
MMLVTTTHIWRSWPPLAIIVFTVWYLFLFQPVVVVKTEFAVDGNQFVFSAYSYKTMLGNSLCNKPSLAVLQFEDAAQNVRNVADNAKGYGSGDASVRQWKSTGTIPPGLSPGVGAVWKKLVYPCIFGTVREIKTKFIPIVINPRPDSIGD